MSTREMDTRILRFDHLHDIPAEKEKQTIIRVSDDAGDAENKIQIAANSRGAFSIPYQNDAVEFAYA